MGQQYSEISDKLKNFINDQKLFFVGTATSDSRVNISPKGINSLNGQPLSQKYNHASAYRAGRKTRA